MRVEEGGDPAPRDSVPTDEDLDDTYDPHFHRRLGDPWCVESANPLTDALALTRELAQRKHLLVGSGGGLSGGVRSTFPPAIRFCGNASASYSPRACGLRGSRYRPTCGESPTARSDNSRRPWNR